MGIFALRASCAASVADRAWWAYWRHASAEARASQAAALYVSGVLDLDAARCRFTERRITLVGVVAPGYVGDLAAAEVALGALRWTLRTMYGHSLGPVGRNEKPLAGLSLSTRPLPEPATT